MGFAGGCAGTERFGKPVPSAGTTATCMADWNDVVASVNAAVGQCESAIERIDESQPDVVTFSLRTIYDEPGTLVVERTPGPDPVMCTLRARLGRDGDAKREAALIRDVKYRLGQLRGRDYAPLPDGWE